MNPGEIDTQLCTACSANQAACCKSGSVFLAAEEHAALLRHCQESADAALLADFEARVTVHDGFALLDQRDACIFLDGADRCTLHGAGLKPQECHWWPLHVYAEPDDRDGAMSVCLADYCCAGIASLEAARRFAGLHLDRMVERLPALRRFRAVFPGTAPRRRVCRISNDRPAAGA